MKFVKHNFCFIKNHFHNSRTGIKKFQFALDKILFCCNALKAHALPHYKEKCYFQKHLQLQTNKTVNKDIKLKNLPKLY